MQVLCFFIQFSGIWVAIRRLEKLSVSKCFEVGRADCLTCNQNWKASTLHALVRRHCHNKQQPSRWLTTTEIDFSPFWRLEVWDLSPRGLVSSEVSLLDLEMGLLPGSSRCLPPHDLCPDFSCLWGDLD